MARKIRVFSEIALSIAPALPSRFAPPGDLVLFARCSLAQATASLSKRKSMPSSVRAAAGLAGVMPRVWQCSCPRCAGSTTCANTRAANAPRPTPSGAFLRQMLGCLEAQCVPRPEMENLGRRDGVERWTAVLRAVTRADRLAQSRLQQPGVDHHQGLVGRAARRG